uniref:Transmembrane protein n=1 Tax=Knipowitschia caucasica TaxID=637954 RepID=A0AAV2MLU8_KNICA
MGLEEWMTRCVVFVVFVLVGWWVVEGMVCLGYVVEVVNGFFIMGFCVMFVDGVECYVDLLFGCLGRVVMGVREWGVEGWVGWLWLCFVGWVVLVGVFYFWGC